MLYFDLMPQKSYFTQFHKSHWIEIYIFKRSDFVKIVKFNTSEW
jgi:hypothetical protein